MSEAHLDQGYTSYEDAVRYRRMREDANARPVTSAQKNRNGRIAEEQHAHRKERGMLEPDAAALNNMTLQQKAEIIDGIQNARVALEAAKLGVGNTVAIEPVTELSEPVQGELPFGR